MPGENQNFSENNLVNLDGFDYGFSEGGHALMSMAYLARWGGPVNESDDPYPNPGGSPGGLTVQKHVQQVRLIPPKASATDNDAIKQAVMDHGGLYVNYWHNDTYYNSTYRSYRYTGTNPSNPGWHAVTIVGWDDNFDKSKFNYVPAGNGAYIVKNSWGTGWGESGYYYVSYYDTQMGYGEIYAFLNAEATTVYKTVYQYDPLGWVSNLGYGGANTTMWGANIFTASTSERLGAVGFYAPALNTAYEIYVYTGVSAGVPRSGTLAATKTGTCTYPGYRAISLDSTVPLTSGQRFSIVIKLTTPGLYYPFAYEYAYAGYSSTATASPGQSYYSSAGTTWSDLTGFSSTANFCIKGYLPTDQTLPTFSSIAASPSPAKLGTVVSITFSASETLAANPTVTVNAHAATYMSKTGNNYTYIYTIQASDPDGDATIAISGTDPAGNPGSANNTTVLDVDKTEPAITSITSTIANGTYGVGAAINVTLNFSEAVTLAGGNLVITMETGTTDRQVMITTISGAASAGATYTVQAGDTSPDLSVNSVALSGGATLRDAAGNNSNLGIPAGQNLNDNKDIVILATCTLQVASAFGGASPAVGSHVYDNGATVACSAVSPATIANSFSNVTAVCTGWTGTGSVPASGSGTGTGPFPITADSEITWLWQVTDMVVSNQTVTGTAVLEARDSITAKEGYTIENSANVNFRVGPDGFITLDPSFEAKTGSVFNVEIGPAP